MISFTILIVWLAITLFLMWWFQFRYITQFDEHWVTFKGSQSFNRVKVLPSDRPLVMHFIDPQCPCSKFSKPHIEELNKKFSDLAEFIYYKPNIKYPRISNFDFDIPAGPAVAIWSKHGVLSYFGPYSGGSVCGQGEDFVARILKSLKNGHTPEWINQEATGCFCKWI